MLLKFKICLTVFVLYEIVAVALLHSMRVCTSIFSSGFCTDSAFKYFLICAALPAVAFLIWIWIMEIVRTVHRRRSFFYRAKTTVQDMAKNVKDTVRENVSAADLEKMIAAALLVGIKKYVARNTYADSYDDAPDTDAHMHTPENHHKKSKTTVKKPTKKNK